MKLCHNISLRVFANLQDKEKIEQTLGSLLPTEKERQSIKVTNVLGADEKTPIIIYEAVLTKDKSIRDFIEKLKSCLKPEHKQLLLRQENRLDSSCNYYIRLDKQKLLEGIYLLTDSGNCFHIRFCIAVFPKNRKVALEKVQDIFSK